MLFVLVCQWLGARDFGPPHGLYHLSKLGTGWFQGEIRMSPICVVRLLELVEDLRMNLWQLLHYFECRCFHCVRRG